VGSLARSLQYPASRQLGRIGVVFLHRVIFFKIPGGVYMKFEWTKHGLVLALGAAGLTALPHATFAQGPAAEAGDGVEEVIVSARYRKESLQDTPVAITAINTASLDNKATLNLGDLQGAAPNILITKQDSGAASANVSIRGLTFADVEKSFDPTVAVVVDGVFIGTSTGQYFDFFDVEQLEVLRGPQGTLFGRNTIGGVIKMQRTRPTGEWGAKVEVSAGNYGGRVLRTVVNAPVVEGKLAAKLFFFHNEGDGFVDHAILNRKVGATDNDSYGASFLFTPNEDFDALLTVEKQKQYFEVINSNIAKTGEVFCLFEPAGQCDRNTTDDLYTAFGDPGRSDYDAKAATLEMNWRVGGATITSVTGFRKSDEFQTQDFDASSADLYFATRTQDFKQKSQELRIGGNFTDSLDYVAGVYYFDSTYNIIQDTRVFGGPAPRQTTQGNSTSYAVFGDFNWAFADGFRLSFGGRYTKDEKENFNNVGGTQFPRVKYKGSKFTPKVGVDWRPNDDVMYYASFSRGYRSGGFSGRGQTLVSSTTPYGPESVDSIEVGMKASFMDDRLQLNLAAFHAKYKDLQQNTTVPLPDPGTGSVGNETIVTNVGSAKIKGIEADLTARITENFRLTASLGTLDSNFSGFITQEQVSDGEGGSTEVNLDYSNNNLIYNPKVTASLNATYEQVFGTVEGTFNLGYRHISPYDQQISKGPSTTVGGVIVFQGNDPRVKSDTQGFLDASATFAFPVGENKAKLTLWGRNLTDDRGPVAAFTVAGLWSFSSPREPRTYGVTVGFEF
jgi:iron complex outermembrane recepter protein